MKIDQNVPSNIFCFDLYRDRNARMIKSRSHANIIYVRGGDTNLILVIAAKLSNSVQLFVVSMYFCNSFTPLMYLIYIVKLKRPSTQVK